MRRKGSFAPVRCRAANVKTVSVVGRGLPVPSVTAAGVDGRVQHSRLGPDRRRR